MALVGASASSSGAAASDVADRPYFAAAPFVVHAFEDPAVGIVVAVAFAKLAQIGLAVLVVSSLQAAGFD